jgi:hypothetical protein
LLDAFDPPDNRGVIIQLVEVLRPHAQFRSVVEEEEAAVSGFVINARSLRSLSLKVSVVPSSYFTDWIGSSSLLGRQLCAGCGRSMTWRHWK